MWRLFKTVEAFFSGPPKEKKRKGIKDEVPKHLWLPYPEPGDPYMRRFKVYVRRAIDYEYDFHTGDGLRYNVPFTCPICGRWAVVGEMSGAHEMTTVERDDVCIPCFNLLLFVFEPVYKELYGHLRFRCNLPRDMVECILGSIPDE